MNDVDIMLVPTTPAISAPLDLSDGRFKAYNIDSNFEQPENVQEYFSLTAQPDSKVSRSPPGEDEINSPMILTKLNTPFILAEVTVSADFEMDWDQGGLIIFAGSAPGQSSPTLSQMYRRRHVAGGIMHREIPQQRGKWAKVGLEFTGGELGVSTVVANPSCGADWSFTPAFPSLTPREAFSMAMPSLRVKLERVGCDLWVWYRIPDDPPTALTARTPGVMSRNWKKCREISGFFDGISVKSGTWIGCYASRPMDLDDPCEEDGLFVEFEDLEVM